MSKPVNKLRAVHPGEILADELRELGLTARAFAGALKVPHNRISAILNGQRGISCRYGTAACRLFRNRAAILDEPPAGLRSEDNRGGEGRCHP